MLLQWGLEAASWRISATASSNPSPPDSPPTSIKIASHGRSPARVTSACESHASAT
eukprot:CAMPEP_0180154158 /NCGR_PEP_ID=MMETSP0986-20121125/23989_1 /TAXON_ID=697907 /ORGANISM="non described non described, Strain CCMP2293" /LENGTH=55 /DNA_ID=CAMNT_0022102453 /DNA_START=186 /DNA_END=350 /DNA_ORIENTATION=+